MRQDDDRDALKARIAKLEAEVGALRAQRMIGGRGIRKRSAVIVYGLPLYDIALGPDIERGQWRGHAKGILAIGDMATGVVAIGGLSRGGIAIGGLALGVVSFGGLSLGLLASIGGLALSFLLAFGGGAVAPVAVGGGAVGYYACGGGAIGKYTIQAVRRDREAQEFFRTIGLASVCHLR